MKNPFNYWWVSCCFFILAISAYSTNANAQIITDYAGYDTVYYGYAGDGGPATGACFDGITCIRTDKKGNLYMVDQYNFCIRKVSTDGIITTVAGNGNYGHYGDSVPATNAYIIPYSIAVDTAGNLFIGEWDYYDGTTYFDSPSTWYVSPCWIRKVDTAGFITTITGIHDTTSRYTGEGGPASAAILQSVGDVVPDNNGNLFVVDGYAGTIYKINKAGIITTIAGVNNNFGYSGDAGPATAALINNPTSLLPDGNGNLYIADNGNNNVRKLNDSGIITTFAGSGYFFGDGNPATVATLNDPLELTIDPAGNIYIADNNDNVARVVTTDGIIHTFAGNFFTGNSGDGGPAKEATFISPKGIAADYNGNVYISDYNNSRVRKVAPLATAGVKTEETALAINIWPEPNNGKFTVKLNTTSNEIVKIMITNILGQKIQQVTSTTNCEIMIQMSAPPGIYFLAAVTANGILTRKIVVE